MSAPPSATFLPLPLEDEELLELLLVDDTVDGDDGATFAPPVKCSSRSSLCASLSWISSSSESSAFHAELGVSD